MKTIVLYGHESAAQEALAQLDTMLRERHIQDVKLLVTLHVDQATGRKLRLAGGALWYCGATLEPPGGGWSPLCADQYLIGRTFEARAARVTAALFDFLRREPS